MPSLSELIDFFEPDNNPVRQKDIIDKFNVSPTWFQEKLKGKQLINTGWGMYRLSPAVYDHVREVFYNQDMIKQGILRRDKQQFTPASGITEAEAHAYIKPILLQKAAAQDLLVHDITFKGNNYEFSFIVKARLRVEGALHHLIFDYANNSPEAALNKAKVFEGKGQWELAAYFKNLYSGSNAGTPIIDKQITAEMIVRHKYPNLQPVRMSELHAAIKPPNLGKDTFPVEPGIKFDPNTRTLAIDDAFYKDLSGTNAKNKLGELINKFLGDSKIKGFASMTFKNILPTLGFTLAASTVLYAEDKINAVIEEANKFSGAVGGGILGTAACGPLCGLGGAAVGAMVGEKVTPEAQPLPKQSKPTEPAKPQKQTQATDPSSFPDDYDYTKAYFEKGFKKDNVPPTQNTHPHDVPKQAPSFENMRAKAAPEHPPETRSTPLPDSGIPHQPYVDPRGADVGSDKMFFNDADARYSRQGTQKILDESFGYQQKPAFEAKPKSTHFEESATFSRKFSDTTRNPQPPSDGGYNLNNVVRDNKPGSTWSEHPNIGDALGNTFHRLGMGPSLAAPDFRSQLIKTGLHDSYNGLSPHSNVRSLRHSSGEIGGVASEVGQISTFSNTVAHAKISTDGLIIALPIGNMPFQETLVQQVLREVIDLRLIHKTDVFLSLNFAMDGSLISIAHPALKGRLLGDIALWIDFELKGILNGYALPKAFASTWEATRNRDENYLRPHAVSLKEYCKKKPCQGKPYFSLRELMSQHGVENTDDALAQPYQISFRVIASQSRIEMHDNVIVPYPKFRVAYTIEKTAAFTERLEAHRRATGSYPESYQKLELACFEYAQEIETKLPDMPFSGQFLYLLGIANAWSHVTETLKQLGLVALLTPKVYAQAYPFPSVLPPLPVASFKTVPLNITFHDVLQAIDNEPTIHRDLNRALLSLFSSRKRPTFPENATALLTPVIAKLSQDTLAPFIRTNLSDSVVTQYTWRVTQLFTQFALIIRSQVDAFVNTTLTELEAANHTTPTQPVNLSEAENPQPARRARASAYRKLSPRDQINALRQSLKEQLQASSASETNTQVLQKAFPQLEHYALVIQAFAKFLLTFRLTSVSVTHQYTHEDIQFSGQTSTTQRVKLVGGCVSDLPTMSTIPMTHGADFKRDIEANVPNAPETFTKLSFEGNTYQVFRVPVTDLDDEAPPRVYLQQPQLSTEEDDRTARRLIMQLSTGNISNLSPHFTQPMDQSGATLTHYAAIALPLERFIEFYTANPTQLRVSDDRGHSPIHLVAQAGDVDKVKWIVQHHPVFLEATAQQSLSTLWIAVQWGRLNVVDALIAAGARVFYQRTNELFPLYVAIQNGFSEVALSLLNRMQVQQANITLVDGMTAVHEAIENHLWDVATALIHKGIALNTPRKNDGFTPFHSAVTYGQVSLISLMLQKGVDINHPAVFGNTPLHMAARTGDIATLTVLRQHHANEALQNSAGETALMVALTASQEAAARLLAEQSPLNLIDKQGRSASLLAIQHGMHTIFDQLLARGEDPLTRPDGLDVLYHLVSQGDYFRVQRLLALPSFNKDATYHDRDFVEIAAQFGHFAIVDLFRVERGTYLQTPVDTSLVHDIVQHDEVALLRKCLPLPEKKILWLTITAAEKASVGCLNVLLPLLSKRPRETRGGQFPENLLLAGVRSGHPQVIRLLMQALPSTKNWLNVPLNKQKETALHISARFGFVQMVKTCLELGADVRKRNKQKQTVYHIALLQQNDILLDVLLQETAPTDWPEDLTDAQRYPASPEVKTIFKKYKQQLPLRSINIYPDSSSSRGLSAGSMDPADKPRDDGEECPIIPTPLENDQLTTLLKNTDFEEAAALFQDKPALLNLFQTPQGGQLWRLIFQGLYEPSKIMAFFGGAASHDALFTLLKAQHIEPQQFKAEGNVLRDILMDEGKDLALYRLEVLHHYFPDNLVPLLQDSYLPQVSFTQAMLQRQLFSLLTKIDEWVRERHDDQSGAFLGLHEAVLAGNIAAVQDLLSHYPIDALNTQQQTALMLATKRGNTPMVQLLLRKGANPNLIDAKGDTLLHFAIASGHQDTALSILPLSIHKNRPNHQGLTPLMMAASQGVLPIVLALSQDGDYTQDTDKNGWSALHWAAQSGQISCIKALVAHGHALHQTTDLWKNKRRMSSLSQDVADFQQERRNRQFTPLHLALLYDQPESVSTLRALGDNLSQTDVQGFGACEYAMMSKRLNIEQMAITWPKCQDASRQLPLLYAAAERDNVYAIYAWVIQHPRLQVTQALNDEKQQLLHICALHNAHRVARYVLENYPVALDAVDKAGYTPLTYAAYLGHVAMVELFAHYGANLNAQHTIDKKTALHHACEADDQGSHHGVVHVLMTYGADLKLLDAEGRTPLQALHYPFAVANISHRTATKHPLAILPETTEAFHPDPPVLLNPQPTYLPSVCADSHSAQAKVFCTELMGIPSHELTASEKQLLLQVSQQFFKQAMQENDPAEWLVMTQYIRKTFGSHMLYRLFLRYIHRAAKEEPMTFQSHTALMQAMLDLHESPELDALLLQTTEDHQVLEKLQAAQEKMLRERYPERSIDDVLKTFQTKSSWVQHPITAQEAAVCKTSYLTIRQELKRLPQQSLEALTRQLQALAKAYQNQANANTQASLIAIIVEIMRRTNKLGLYDTQLLAILLFLQKHPDLAGLALQMGSGQGKSATIVAFAGYLTTIGRTVGITTTAAYLGERDIARFKAFFYALGVNASSISHVRQTAAHFNANILFGMVTDYQFAFLRAGLWHQNVQGNRPFDVLIADEFDAHFFDNAFHAARLAVPSKEDLGFIYAPIWALVQRKVNPSVKQLKRYLHTQVDAVHREKLTGFSDARLARWITSANTALHHLKEGRDYVVERATHVISSKQRTKDGILIIDFANNGRPSEGSQWQDGIHQFLELKHGLPITPEMRTGASISVRNFLSLYKTIFALSGTLGNTDERAEMRSIANIDTRDIPYRFPSLLKIDPPEIVKDDASQYEIAFQNISALRAKGRPVLVLMETIQEVKNFNDFLRARSFNHHQVLTTQQKENENYLIARAGNTAQVTFSTNAAGRGTDILLSPESLKAGGLYVLKLFYPKNTRVQQQAENRAARLGQPGGTGMILSFESRSVQHLLQNRYPWSAPRTKEILNLLEQFRAEHTKAESLQRQHYGQAESVVFNYLTAFFKQNQQLYQTLNSAEFKARLHVSDDQADRLIKAALDATQQSWSIFYDELQHHQPFTADSLNQFHTQHERLLKAYQQLPKCLSQLIPHLDSANPSGLIEACMQLLQSPPTVEQATHALRNSFFAGQKDVPLRVINAHPVCVPQDEYQPKPMSWSMSFFNTISNITTLHLAKPGAAPTMRELK